MYGDDARGVNHRQLKQIYGFSNGGLWLIEVMKNKKSSITYSYIDDTLFKYLSM